MSGQIMVSDEVISRLDVCSHSGTFDNRVGLEEIHYH